MSERTHPSLPPRGLARLLFRLPLLVYRIGLAGLLGRRFVMLKHRGRHSRKWRAAVLEVIGEDQQAGRIFVVSAWGERSDWLRNLRKTPEVSLQIGRQRERAVAQPLDPDRGAALLRAYAERHPLVARVLARLFGYSMQQLEHDFGRLAADMVVVALQWQLSADHLVGAEHGE